MFKSPETLFSKGKNTSHKGNKQVYVTGILNEMYFCSRIFKLLISFRIRCYLNLTALEEGPTLRYLAELRVNHWLTIVVFYSVK